MIDFLKYLNDHNSSISHQEKLLHFIPLIFNKDKEAYRKIIFSDLPPDFNTPTKTTTSENTTSTYSLIYNQTNFCQKIDLSLDKAKHETEGKPLELKPGLPIGYNIYVPDGECKGVLVRVYGGTQAKDNQVGQKKKLEVMFLPNELNKLEERLIQNGIAVVTLNLADIRNLNKYQLFISKEFHEKLHNSIDKFYKTLTQSPEMIDGSADSALKKLVNKPICLFGESYANWST